ncbi:MAG: hypothetical protein K2X32_06190, partial [Phycisphaerales bacterium]|nr:hypothetical protein [Phycisphaerales bacterium]
MPHATHSDTRPTPNATAMRGYRRAAARLCSEVRALVALIPAQHRTASRLARWLKVDRSLCSRFLAADTQLDEPVQVFALLPGVDGFRAVIRALGRCGVDRSRVARALAAANTYEECVGLAGGSQSKLVRLTARLAAEPPVEIVSPLRTASGKRPAILTPRALMFNAMSELTGTNTQACSLTYAVRPR